VKDNAIAPTLYMAMELSNKGWRLVFMEGKHHHISSEMLRKYGAPEEVAHAAEAHHDDMEVTTVEALIVRVVDAISASSWHHQGKRHPRNKSHRVF
jgi:hypothetical protein